MVYELSMKETFKEKFIGWILFTIFIAITGVIFVYLWIPDIIGGWLNLQSIWQLIFD